MINQYNISSYQCYTRLSKFLSSDHSNHIELYLNFQYQQEILNEVEGLSKGLANCMNLRSLALNFNYTQMGSKGALSQIQLGSFVHLRTLILKLEGNEMDAQSAQILGTELAKCVNLTTLSIEMGSLYQICTSLNQFNMGSSNQIYPKGGSALCAGLVNCKNLINLTLDLQSNYVGQYRTSCLGPELANCLNLINLTLNLKSNYVSTEGIKGLCSGLANLTKLTTLDLNLSYNTITGLGVGLANCLNLKNLILILESCSLDKDMKEIVDITNCAKFTTLKFQLRMNGLNDEFISGLSTRLSNSITLNSLSLDLCKNSISKEAIANLCIELENCKNLKYFALQYEGYNFSVQGASIGSANCLNFINLAHEFRMKYNDNQATSNIKTRYSNCVNLTSLTLNLQINMYKQNGATFVKSSGSKNLCIELAKCINLNNLTINLNSFIIANQDLQGLFRKMHRLVNVVNSNPNYYYR